MINSYLYSKELKRNRNSFISWSISMVALLFLGMAFYPVLMEGDTLKQMKAFFKNPMMKGLLNAFGATIDQLSNVLGFYATRNAVFIMLLGSMFSIMLAAKILSREEREKTAEFLLSKPVTRTEVAGSKLAAYFTYLILLNIVMVSVGFATLEFFKGDSEYSLTAYLMHAFYSFLLMLLFGAIGFFLSVLIKRGRSMTNVALGVVLGSYFIDFISKVTPAANDLGYLSPFKFIPAGIMNPNYGLNWASCIYFAGISLVLFILSFVFYNKKDILV